MQANIKEVSKTLLYRASEDIVTLVEAMPEDRLHWKPVDSVRQTAFTQVYECLIVNSAWDYVIRGRGVHDLNITPPAVQALYDTQPSTPEELVIQLRQTTADLVMALADVPEEETGNKVPVWSGTMLLAECFLYPYWHMVYHEGQINLIQTCYDDQKSYHNYET